MSISRDAKWAIGIVLAVAIAICAPALVSWAQVRQNTSDITSIKTQLNQNTKDHQDIMRSLGRIEGMLEDKHE